MHACTKKWAKQHKQALLHQGKSCGAQPISAGCLYLHSHVISSQCNSSDVDLTDTQPKVNDDKTERADVPRRNTDSVADVSSCFRGVSKVRDA